MVPSGRSTATQLSSEVGDVLYPRRAARLVRWSLPSIRAALASAAVALRIRGVAVWGKVNAPAHLGDRCTTSTLRTAPLSACSCSCLPHTQQRSSAREQTQPLCVPGRRWTQHSGLALAPGSSHVAPEPRHRFRHLHAVWCRWRWALQCPGVPGEQPPGRCCQDTGAAEGGAYACGWVCMGVHVWVGRRAFV